MKTKTKFQADHLCLIHPGRKSESFPLQPTTVYMFFDEKGTSKLAFDTGTDWIDFEESELIGESETLVRVWGVPVTESDVKTGLAEPLTLDVNNGPKKGGVLASFFGSVGHRVDRVVVEFPGAMRVRAALHVVDITEETDECNTVVTIETTLNAPGKIERPD